jgi:hypothetical protein
VDSAHFSSHEKRSYPTLAYTGKHLANYSQRLSIISKQSKLIPKELRYQEKRHAIICYTKRKKILQILPKYFFFIILKKWNMEKHHMQGKIKPDDANTEKIVARPAFSVFPKKKVLIKFSQEK